MTIQATITGRLSKDGELTYGRDGKPRLRLTIPDQKRRKNEQTGDWENASATTWITATVFGDQAEQLAEQAKKGTHAVITGRLITREYTTQNGEQRTSLEVDYPTVGLAPAPQTYTGHRQPDGQWTPDTGRGGWGGQTTDDPWAGQQSASQEPF